MTQAPPTQLTTENRVPDCVFMKLHTAQIQPTNTTQLGFQISESASVLSVEQIDLKLTIRFNKMIIKCPGGSVEFGLKRGELALRLENGKIPLEKVALKAEFAKALEIEEQVEKGRESEAAIAVAAGVKTKDADKVARKVKQVVPQVTNRGTEEHPIWEFQVQASREQLILLGQLTEEAIGILEIMAKPCSLTATFCIQHQSDIHLFDSTGLIAGRNLSRNKTAWAAREFFLRFIAPQLQPHLSRVEGHYE